MNGQRRKIYRPNFTLIELLVVLVVIAILMSLLMGALKNARETARTVECMARLRSFHQWQHLYRVDNDMWFVVNRTWGPDPGGPDIPNPDSPQHYDTFVNALKTYMGEPLATTDWSSTAGDNYFLCPGNGYVVDPPPLAVKVWEYTHIDSWRLTNYMTSAYFGYGDMGMAWDVPSSAWSVKQPFEDYWVKKTVRPAAPAPAAHFLIGEIKGVDSRIGYFDDSSQPIYPHAGQTNVMMVDGNVERYHYPLVDHLNNGFRFR